MRCCLTGDRILAEDVQTLRLAPTVAKSSECSAFLRFASDESGRTHIERQFAPYPFHFCRPFYLDDDPDGMATVYIQSCAGGIFAHDALHLSIDATPGAKAHVTTAASTIVHSMPVGQAKQSVSIVAAENTLVEYLPDPMILFVGSRVKSSIDLILQPNACVMLSDAFLLHDYRALGGAFDSFHGDITVRDTTGEVVVRDRIRVNGKDLLGVTPGLMGSCVAQASVMLFCRQEFLATVLDGWRYALDNIDGIYAGASLMRQKLGIFARIIADDGAALREAQLALWRCARVEVTARTPMPRRK